jgi:UDP-N-acetyl-D-glucosamine dehydrogenase
MNNIHKFIENRSAKIGIFGLGYVGIPLALRFSKVGFSVVGFDIVEDRIAQLNSGVSPIKHIEDASIRTMRENGFEATMDFSSAAECTVLIICVPTPLNKMREPDLSFVMNTMASIEPYLREGQILSLESTTWPGTTNEVLLPIIERAGLSVGDNFHLVYSPEREDPGNVDFKTQGIPKIVGGDTPECLEAGLALYGSIVDKVVPVNSTRTAEMVKLVENIHRAVNIGLVNELKIICDLMGLDIFEIIDAAATKPFGFTPYYPGPGVGGHCIPVDPFYLTWKAREHGLHTRFIEIAGEINASMPDYALEKTLRALGTQGKSLNGAKVLVLGVAYKRDVDDVRESPSVFLMEKLRAWGALVQYSDPCVPIFPKMREHKFDLLSVDLSPESLSSFDAILLMTDHSDFDYDLIRDNARIIIDTRGKYRGEHPTIWRA